MKKCIICGKDLPHQKNKSNKVYEAQRFCSNQCIGKYRSGENNNKWLGDEVGYDGVHRWVQSKKGKATKCEHCGRTDKKKYEWCNIDHTYKRVLEDYIQLCTSCHRKWDYRFYKPNFDVEEAKRLKSEGLSYRAIARKLGVRTHGTIQRYLDNQLNSTSKNST